MSIAQRFLVVRGNAWGARAPTAALCGCVLRPSQGPAVPAQKLVQPAAMSGSPAVGLRRAGCRPCAWL